jgi:hypothetical protein
MASSCSRRVNGHVERLEAALAVMTMNAWSSSPIRGYDIDGPD